MADTSDKKWKTMMSVYSDMKSSFFVLQITTEIQKCIWVTQHKFQIEQK